MHLLLFLRMLRHSLATPSTEGLLDCLRKQALERNGQPTAQMGDLLLAIRCDSYHSMYAMRPGRRNFSKSCNCTRKHI
ncbi:hypothetical protein C8R45DRAFT_982495 [Mycena sanguinolenta]|nr:hypothetical protein C8R45DRAFT_982495 [Mycena sanguinolenta]